MQRLFNYAFLGIIGLSLLAQTMRFGLAISGSANAFVVSVLEVLGAAIVPGTVLAVLKFLFCAVRSFRDAGARLLAGCYALIMVWPLVLGGIVAWNAVQHMTEPAQGGWRELKEPGRGESEAFLEGQAWAGQNRPTRRTECLGVPEFVRGCAAWIRADRDAQARAGSDWAQRNRPERPSQCQGTPDFVLGCRTFYNQQLAAGRAAGPGPFGTSSTEECIVEVNANYEVAARLDILDGNERAPEVTRRRHWQPDLQACEQLGPRR